MDAANFAIAGILCEVDCEHCGGRGSLEIPKVKRCACSKLAHAGGTDYYYDADPNCEVCKGSGEDQKTSANIVKCGRCHRGKVLTPFGKEMLQFVMRYMVVEDRYGRGNTNPVLALTRGTG